VFEWLFKYPWAEFARGRLMLAGAWPVAALWILWVAGAVLLTALAIRRHRSLAGWQVGLVALLQTGVLGLALLLIWQPALFLQSLRSGENSVAVLLDNSESMAFVDGGTARMQQARSALASPALQRLAQNYSFQRYAFAAGAEPVSSFDALPAAGTRTAIGDSVLQVLRALRTTALGAVVVVSDGADSAGALSPDQLTEIASYGVPVHVVGIGREVMPEDLELSDVLLPDHALPGTTLSARASIRHDGAGTTRVKVYDGERFLSSREVALPAQSTLTTVPINLELAESGYRDLHFSLEAKPGESEVRNNDRTRIVDVSDRRASVLYVEGEPRWDYKFIRRALDKDEGVRLMSLLRTSTNGYYRQGVVMPDELKEGFPTDKKSLYAYDALIIGSMPAAWFRPQQQALIRDFVSERGGTLMMLAGPNGLGDGAWGNTQVGGILPTQLPASGNTFHRVRGAAVLTVRGRRTPMLQFSDNPTENEKLWRELPLLADYQDVGALRLGAASLLDIQLPGAGAATAGTGGAAAGTHEQPLFVTQSYGRGRTFILATGGTWRWRMGLPHEDQRQVEFWRQVMRALVTDVPRPFELTARTEADGISVRADIRDEAFAPQNDLTVRASASSTAGGGTFELHPDPEQPGVYLGQFRPEHSGSWVIEAQAQRAGKSAGSARAIVRYEQGAAEYFGLRQNRSLLEQLAAATGGRYWRPEQLEGLSEAVRASRAGVAQQEVLPLWDAPAAFLLLAALKAGEWLLRRRWGAV
jgi:uncharacterized membrane protein